MATDYLTIKKEKTNLEESYNDERSKLAEA